MTYELAKKLKDAGFPQKINDYVASLDEDTFYSYYDIVREDEDGEPVEDRAKTPNLAELIEACGKDFKALVRHDTGHNIYWIASSADGEFSFFTPIEAVANLWLALHKKPE